MSEQLSQNTNCPICGTQIESSTSCPVCTSVRVSFFAELEKLQSAEKVSLTETSVMVLQPGELADQIDQAMLVDLPQLAETPGNPMLVGRGERNTTGLVLKASRGNQITFHKVEAMGKKDEKFVFSLPKVTLESVQDPEFLQQVSQSITNIMYDDFQGKTFAESSGIDFDFHNVSNFPLSDGTGNDALFGGINAKRRENRSMMPLKNWLTNDQLHRVADRKNYAMALGLSFNAAGQFVIQGAGFMSQDFCGRGLNPNAFFIVLNRNDVTEKLMAILAQDEVSERAKRELLGTLYELCIPSFPKQATAKTIAKNYFYNQPTVDLVVANRLEIPRIEAEELRSETSGEFYFENLADAIEAEVQFRAENQRNTVDFHTTTVLENGGRIHLSHLSADFLSSLKKALDSGYFESASCDNPHCNTADISIKRFIEWKPQSFPNLNVPLTVDAQTSAESILTARKILAAITVPKVIGKNKQFYDLSNPQHLYVLPTQLASLKVMSLGENRSELRGLLVESGLAKAMIDINTDVQVLLTATPKHLKHIVLDAKGSVEGSRFKNNFDWLLNCGFFTGTVEVTAALGAGVNFKRAKFKVPTDIQTPEWLFENRADAQAFVNNHKTLRVYHQSAPGKFERLSAKFLGNLF